MNTTLQELAIAIDERPDVTCRSPRAMFPDRAWVGRGPEEQTIPLSHYLWVLRRHSWKILSFIAISVVATLIVSKRLTPIYESTVTVDVDRKVPMAVVGQESNQTRSTMPTSSWQRRSS